MTEDINPEVPSPYEMEQSDNKRAKRSKLIIIGSGIAVGASMLIGAGVVLSHEISEHETEEHSDRSDNSDSNLVDPKGEFTPGYAPGEEQEHLGNDEEHPEHKYEND